MNGILFAINAFGIIWLAMSQEIKPDEHIQTYHEGKSLFARLLRRSPASFDVYQRKVIEYLMSAEPDSVHYEVYDDQIGVLKKLAHKNRNINSLFVQLQHKRRRVAGYTEADKKLDAVLIGYYNVYSQRPWYSRKRRMLRFAQRLEEIKRLVLEKKSRESQPS
jgi:hypothetical protein